MSIFQELIDSLAPLRQRLRVPPISRVCIPPACNGQDKAGEFLAVELEGGHVGLAYMLLGNTERRIRSEGLPDVRGEDPCRLIGEGGGASEPRRVLVMACVNALSQWLFQRAGFALDWTGDSLAELAFGPGDRAGMVGFFTPLVPRLRALGVPLTVLELKQELVREEEGLRIILDPAQLAPCNKVLCTSTVVLNDSLEQALAHCEQARVALIGPGAGMIPDPLFARGVDILGGVTIRDPDEFFRRCREGASWGGTGAKYCLRAGDYPGLKALLESV